MRCLATSSTPVTPLLHLVEGLPHADQAGAAAGAVDDHVRQGPAHLLGLLVAHRLFALDPVRFLEGGHVKAAKAAHPLGGNSAAVGD
jgi:hypothetical protein